MSDTTYFGSEFIRSASGSVTAGQSRANEAAEQQTVGAIQPLGGALDEGLVERRDEPPAGVLCGLSSYLHQEPLSAIWAS
ncbi:hypothetical protein [Amycolatopsis circi]|uniref:hypothetical protein n=1 Tax=Amycolatopsis circi TaxID=871959 RepID=UPI0013BE9A1C|nr:hypothetical protein [Amycolatopsis circi]